MAIRIHDADVTTAKSGRYADRSAAEARQREVHKLRHREREVRQHRGIKVADLTPEIASEILTTRAFIEVMEWKNSRKSPSRTEMHLAEALQATTERFNRLARKITNHIMMSRKGIIWGESLKDIYREIAETLNEAVADIENAVDIAVGKQLLYRQEATSESVTEWVCINPAA